MNTVEIAVLETCYFVFFRNEFGIIEHEKMYPKDKPHDALMDCADWSSNTPPSRGIDHPMNAEMPN